MIEKRLKKLGKLSILIGIRQIYFLIRNWYLIFREPYLTLKEIKDKQDKSQFVLIIASALSPIWVYIAARIGWDLWKYQRVVWLTGNVFTAVMGIQILILGYLLFWTFRVLREE